MKFIFTHLALLQKFLTEFQHRGDSSASSSHLRTQKLMGKGGKMKNVIDSEVNGSFLFSVC